MSRSTVNALEPPLLTTSSTTGVLVPRADRVSPPLSPRSASAVSSSRPMGVVRPSAHCDEDWDAANCDDDSERRRVRSIRRFIIEQEAAQRGRIVTEALAAWKDLRVDACHGRLLLCLSPSSRGCSRSASVSPAVPKPQEGPSVVRSAPLLEEFYDREVRRAAMRGGRELMRRQVEEAAERERAMDEMEELRVRLAEEALQRRRAMEEARRNAERARAAEADLAALQRVTDTHTAASREALDRLRLRERQVEQLTEETLQLRERADEIARAMRIEREAAQRRREEREAKQFAAETEAAKRTHEAKREIDELQRTLRERDDALREECQRVKELEEQVDKHAVVTEAMRVEIAALQEEAAAIRAELHEAHALRRIAESAKRDAVNAKDNAAEAHKAEIASLQKSLQEQEAEVKRIRQELDAATEEKNNSKAHCSVIAADHLSATSPNLLAMNGEASGSVPTRRPPLLSPSAPAVCAEPTVPSAPAVTAATVAPSPLVQSSVFHTHPGLFTDSLSAVRSLSSVHPSSFAPSAVPVPSVGSAQVWQLPAVAEAVQALLYARDYAVRRWTDQSSTEATAHMALPCKKTERRIIAECIASLTAAVAETRAALSHVTGPHSRGHIRNNHSSGDALHEELRHQQHVLAHVQNELQKAEALRCVGLDMHTQPASAVLVQDAAIAVLIGTLAEQLSILRNALAQSSYAPPYYSTNGLLNSAFSRSNSSSSSHTTTCPRCVNGHTKCNGHGLAKDLGFITRSVSGPSPPQPQPQPQPPLPLRHTFGFVGGRLEISRNGTRLQRLLLPCVMDIMTCSALGAVDHRTALAAAALPNAVFAFTVRVGTRCEGVLVGLADRYMPLEGFGHAQNSCKYGCCYYLHLGRSSLYCPAQGIIDVPYIPFRRASSAGNVAVQAGEEITCLLDPNAQTISFQRNGMDCGVAFTEVNLTRALFPALELNSRGCTIEFV